MSTPVGHTLFGLSIFLGSPFWDRWKWFRAVLFVLVVANLPDLDIFIGFVSGSPNQYHQHFSHSLFFAVLISILTGILYQLYQKKAGFRMGLLTLMILLSHDFLDFLGRDSSYPYGIQLFWPFSQDFYLSPVQIVRSVSKSSSSGTFIQSLFCRHNALTVASELAVFLPLSAGLYLWRKKKNQ